MKDIKIWHRLLTADKRQNEFCLNYLRQLLLSANVMRQYQKIKVLEGIMKSDKRIKSMQIITPINQKGRVVKTDKND